MAWSCGKIISKCKAGLKTRFIGGAAAGAFLYVLLYIAKAFIEDRFVLGLPLEAVMLTVTQKSIISSMNAVIAVIVAVPLGLALRPTAGKFLPDRHGLY